MLLECRNLAYRYPGGPYVFRGVSLSVASGEAVGLIGPSGCGKTTLGRILAGYAAAAEGTVLLDGKPIPPKGYHPVQMVFQHPEKAVNPRWRLRRTLAESRMPEAAELRRLGIDEAWLDRWPHELSAGELQRICIARALGLRTRFLIADEMTAMLDAITQAQIWHAVLAIAKERAIGMLVITHDRALAEAVCDRVVTWDRLSIG